MIPAVIHRVWLDESVPEVFAAFGREWQRVHKTWEVVDWTSTAKLPALQNQALYDNAHDIIPRDWVRFRSDLVRLELLYQCGGVYVDCDTKPLVTLGPLLSCGFFAARSPKKRYGTHPITNAVMGAESGHPLVGALIAALPEAVAKYGDRPLAEMIGPWHLTRVYEGRAWPNTTVLGSCFYREWCEHFWNNTLRYKKVGLA